MPRLRSAGTEELDRCVESKLVVFCHMFCDPTVPLQDICLKEILAQAPTGMCVAPCVAVLLVGAGGKLLSISVKVVRQRDAYTMDCYVAFKTTK